jgi:hypothetical protein
MSQSNHSQQPRRKEQHGEAKPVSKAKFVGLLMLVIGFCLQFGTVIFLILAPLVSDPQRSYRTGAFVGICSSLMLLISDRLLRLPWRRGSDTVGKLAFMLSGTIAATLALASVWWIGLLVFAALIATFAMVLKRQRNAAR